MPNLHDVAGGITADSGGCARAASGCVKRLRDSERRLRGQGCWRVVGAAMTWVVAGCGGNGLAHDAPNASPATATGADVAPVAVAANDLSSTDTDTAAPGSAATSPATTVMSNPLTPTSDDIADRAESALRDDTTFPLTIVDETGAEIVVTSIERIIPLDGTVAEVVFALGLGDHVVATDLSATYPPEADALPEIGYQRALAAETIAAHTPTVLLATDIAGPPEALDDLRRLGYPLVIVPNPSTPTGAGQKIRAVAAALGSAEQGAALAESVDSAIAAASVPADADIARPRVLALYVRGTVAQVVLGESSNTHWLIEAAGGIDVGSEMGVLDSAPISAEAILAAAPDVLLIPAAGLDSVDGVDGLLDIGGLGQTPAGQRRQVLAYDDQLLLGNGPRTAQMLAQLRDDLSTAVVAPTSGTSQKES